MLIAALIQAIEEIIEPIRRLISLQVLLFMNLTIVLELEVAFISVERVYA